MGEALLKEPIVQIEATTFPEDRNDIICYTTSNITSQKYMRRTLSVPHVDTDAERVMLQPISISVVSRLVTVCYSINDFIRPSRSCIGQESQTACDTSLI